MLNEENNHHVAIPAESALNATLVVRDLAIVSNLCISFLHRPQGPDMTENRQERGNGRRRGTRRPGDERAGEIVRVERAQVVETLADADQLHRQAELVGDRDGDPALRRAVELRQRDAGDAGGLAEEARLLEAVLAGGRVDDEERLVRGAFEAALDHAAHLRQLLHQVRLRVQAAGGVDDRDVLAARAGGLDGVVGDRGRVGAPCGADEVRLRAIRPDLELLLGGGAPRVGGAEQRP